ncbi:MAG: FAD binding domain-containing protein [Frankiaceae bacterium]
MKPPPFAYAAPATVEEAVGVLADAGPDGKVLAGGQSLIPLLNMRLAAPRLLVDINLVSALDYVRVDDDAVRVGALARHATVERDEEAWRRLPLLRRALRLVAHPVIRNRGTVCGSLAHADPAGELTAVLALLEGSVTAAHRGPAGVTSIDVAAAELFVGPLESSLPPGRLVTEARFPLPAPGTGTAFVEVARRHGDYAIAGVAAAVALDDDVRVARARVAFISLAPTPLVVDLTDALGGATVATADWAAAGRAAAAATDPEPDIHASADYRRHLAAVLTARALREAADEAAHQALEGGLR